MDNTVEEVVAVIRAVCGHTVQADGLEFDVASVVGIPIKEDADYSGVRVTFLVTLQNARVPMQIDIGFGDVVTPSAAAMDYPVLLDFPVPRLLGYPRETVVAEKFEAMAKLGLLNTRLKDFHDIWLLAQRFEFDGASLASAIQRTFRNRNTPVASLPTALTPAFGSDPTKQRQWQGFLKKTKLDTVPASLQSVIDELIRFLGPVALAVETGAAYNNRWLPPGPWLKKENSSGE